MVTYANSTLGVDNIKEQNIQRLELVYSVLHNSIDIIGLKIDKKIASFNTTDLSELHSTVDESMTSILKKKFNI